MEGENTEEKSKALCPEVETETKTTLELEEEARLDREAEEDLAFWLFTHVDWL